MCPRGVSLQLAAHIEIDGGLLAIAGQTNLPDATNLRVAVARPDGSTLFGQWGLIVSRGRFRSNRFDNSGETIGSLPYSLTISKVADDQPQAVQDAVRDFRGPEIDRSDDGMSITHREAIQIPGYSTAQ